RTATPGVCSVAGSRVSFQHVGDCQLTADQPGDGDYHPAQTRTQKFAVGRGSPRLTFTGLPDAPAFGDHYDASTATSDSDGATTFALGDATTHNACTLDESRTRVTFGHAGLCDLQAEQAQTADYTDASRTTQVDVPKQAPQLSFTGLPDSPTFGE